MLNPFYAAFLLAVEAQKVIELRLVRIAWGGAEAQAEMVSMVGEKVVAAMEAVVEQWFQHAGWRHQCWELRVDARSVGVDAGLDGYEHAET